MWRLVVFQLRGSLVKRFRLVGPALPVEDESQVGKCRRQMGVIPERLLELFFRANQVSFVHEDKAEVVSDPGIVGMH